MTEPEHPSLVVGDRARLPQVPRRVFITGASGYVGRNLVRHFHAAGSEVVALVRSQKAIELVQELGAVAYLGDMLSGDLATGMMGCDALIHAAADTAHGLATKAQFRTNEEGTRRVFQAAKSAGITRAIHISSESVLADGRPLINVKESAPYPHRPAGGYSRSKAAAEKSVLGMNTRSFSVVVVRPRFVWGRDDTTALPFMVQAARSGQLAWIDGGDYLTSTTHIINLCFGIECALSRGRGGEVYFITDGAPIEFRRFASRLLATQGVTAPDKTVSRSLLRTIATIGEMVGKLSGGKFNPPITLQTYATSAVEVTMDISKARLELGYTPLISRDQGLEELTATSQSRQNEAN